MWNIMSVKRFATEDPQAGNFYLFKTDQTVTELTIHSSTMAINLEFSDIPGCFFVTASRANCEPPEPLTFLEIPVA